MRINRLARAVLLAGLAFPALNALPSNAALAATAAPAAISNNAANVAAFKETLSAFGTFIKHERYGEVWVPGVTQLGWHPYPACQWVFDKDVGWYFHDDTVWGKIVHHYGRWQHEPKTGWFWIPDEDWSPGWVSWRMSEKWIGWAPLPPDEDLKTVSADLDTDKLWTFMDAAKFGKGCEGFAAASSVGVVNEVSLFELPRGEEVDLEIVVLCKTKVITKIIKIFIDRQCLPPPPPTRQPNPPLTQVPIRSINLTPPSQSGKDTPPVTRNFIPRRVSWPQSGSSRIREVHASDKLVSINRVTGISAPRSSFKSSLKSQGRTANNSVRGSNSIR